MTNPADRPGRVRSLVRPLQRFLQVEASGGIVLLAATVVALVWANSPWRASYTSVFHTERRLEVGSIALHHDLAQVVDDGLMALFFFVVGLEIKREWVVGELRDRRAAVLPVVAAIGGMAVPAVLYLAVNVGQVGSRGWGIPMATDIAFALGVVTVLGRRVPAPLKVFLLTLAIVDDVGAILVIAVAYSRSISFLWLGGAALVVAAVVVLRWVGVETHAVYLVAGLGLWLCVYRSGVHATIAGVVMGLLTPALPTPGRSSVPLAERLEALLHPWTSYGVIPVFALANAGIVLSSSSFSKDGSILLGVVLGLVVGKAIGITAASGLAVRLGLARLPEGVRWSQLVGVAVLGGIGFTVSLFVTNLAFDPGPRRAQAEVGILAASLIAAVVGSGLLVRAARSVGRPTG